ncbi:(DL)-glycerol-3-phosphatase 2 [Capsicum annuum]|uniref:(DL)-glycerol-3-phosphatase 2 n=1 Tax=Capsicum annuum TaxID=4072 RepID=A0A2G2YL62_CAPAN|nr:(DL)-glycerol-3-phosphatase 2 [Capsicum annuum]
MTARVQNSLREGNTLADFFTYLVFSFADTEKFYTEVQEIILARYNKSFDWSLKAKMMGKKAIEAARVFVEETGISDSLSAEDFLVEREEMLQKMFPTSDLMPGGSRLIHHLHENGIPMCVATGTHKRHFDLKTQRHSKLFSLMHHIVRGDDPEVKQGKPSPDIFLAAANRFEVEAPSQGGIDESFFSKWLTGYFNDPFNLIFKPEEIPTWNLYLHLLQAELDSHSMILGQISTRTLSKGGTLMMEGGMIR